MIHFLIVLIALWYGIPILLLLIFVALLFGSIPFIFAWHALKAVCSIPKDLWEKGSELWYDFRYRQETRKKLPETTFKTVNYTPSKGGFVCPSGAPVNGPLHPVDERLKAYNASQEQK